MQTQLLIIRYILLITFFIIPTLSFSQNFQYIKSGGANNMLDSSIKEEIRNMVTDSQRNLYFISPIGKDGTTLDGSIPFSAYELSPNNPDYILVSYTCDGTYRWHKVFGGGDSDYLADVAVDSQDNVYVLGGLGQCRNAGPSYPYYSIPRIGDNDGVDFTSASTQDLCQRSFRAKFNSNGDFQWLHYLQAPTTSALANSGFLRNTYMVNDVLHCIAILPPGTYEGGAINNTTTSVPFLYYLLKYDTSGNLISATPFDLQMSGYASAELRWYRNPYNGLFYVRYLNTSSNSITLTAGGNSLDYSLSKIICFNDLGQYQWHREPSGTQISFSSIDFDPNNNVYIAGATNSFFAVSFLGWSAPANTGATTYIMKCNPNITSYSWATNFSLPTSPVGYAQVSRVLFYDTFENELILGSDLATNTMYWDPLTITGTGANNSSDPLLARFNPNTGACLSLQRIVGSNGFQDTFTHIEQDAAGDLILGGFMGYDLTDSNGISSFSNGGNSDFFIAKYATQACQPLSTENFEASNLQLFPNPVRTVFTVTVKENTNYQFYTLTGVLIEDGNLSETENTISIAHLPSGCYVLKLKSETGKTKSIKVIKE